MTGHRDVRLCDGQLLPRRDPHLEFHQVDARDHLGDGVLDLQTGVHLHEEEFVGVIGGDDELDRPRTGVVDAARGVARSRPDAGAGHCVQQR